MTLFHFAFLAFCLDIAGFICSFTLVWWLRLGVWTIDNPDVYGGALTLGVLTYIFAAFAEDLYTPKRLRNAFNAIYSALKAALFTFGMMLLVAFLLKVTASYSRIWGVSWALLFLSYLVFSRLLLAHMLARFSASGVIASKAVIIGTGEKGCLIARNLTESARSTVHILGFVDDRPGNQPECGDAKPYLGHLEQFGNLVLRLGIEQVYIAVGVDEPDRLKRINDYVSQWALDVYLMPQHITTIPGTSQFEEIGNDQYIVIAQRPIGRWHAILKRAEDLIFTLLGLALIWPLMLLIALAIKLDSKGPVLYRQKRCGFNGETIQVLKFRSMTHVPPDAAVFKQATKNDSRITRVGKFIRKTSLDELPQLFNVLKGDMSLVGPRPHAEETRANGKLFKDVVARYSARHRVKPGVTGWAQVNGWRGETDTEEKIQRRVEHDFYYINNWSIYLDIFILIKTVFIVVFRNKNAY